MVSISIKCASELGMMLLLMLPMMGVETLFTGLRDRHADAAVKELKEQFPVEDFQRKLALELLRTQFDDGKLGTAMVSRLFGSITRSGRKR